MSTKALENHLKLLTPFLEMEGVTEICINRPQEIYLEQNSQFNRYDVPELTLTNLDTLADLVAEFNHQEITPEKPLLSANLLNGERAQLVKVKAPACEKGKLICAIRPQGMRDMTLDDYVARGLQRLAARRIAGFLADREFANGKLLGYLIA
jgi:type IV secretion system protein VirB11